jgi:hypothetical protein
LGSQEWLEDIVNRKTLVMSPVYDQLLQDFPTAKEKTNTIWMLAGQLEEEDFMLFCSMLGFTVEEIREAKHSEQEGLAETSGQSRTVA